MFDQHFPILGKLEHAIMDMVWSRRSGDGKSVTVREVVESLRPSRAPAYTTVMTVMNRLVKKSLLRRKQDGQSYRYLPTKSREEFLDRSSRQIVERVVKYFGDAAIARFIDVLDDVDPQKIAALRRKIRSDRSIR